MCFGMEGEAPHIIHGLEGVYFTESKICKVDGTLGKLYYRGYPIGALAANSSFEEVCYLLLNGALPTKKQLRAFESHMKAERKLPRHIVKTIAEMTGKAHPTDILRTAVSSLPTYDTEAYEKSQDANLRKSVRLISKMASITATIGRFMCGGKYVYPKRKLSHSANFLYMLTGKAPEEKQAKLLDTMMILHAEHSTNASTFATLVTGSTLADLYAAITSGIAALKGPLHGGADEAALLMLRAIGKPENTEAYVEHALEDKQRIMGFGHRIYKTYDPRARIIKADLEALQSSASEEIRDLTAIALRVEKLMIDKLGQSRGIWPNIDFFAGPIYTEMGIHPDLFTPLFAVSRVPGWCSHMLEYWQNNRLLRPLELYTGPLDLEYVPISKRR